MANLLGAGLSLANTNFKPPLATEIVRDNASSNGSCLEQRHFQSLKSLESRHHD